MSQDRSTTLPPSLESEEVKKALQFLKQHGSEIGSENLQFTIPPEYKNGKVKEFIAGRILSEAKNLSKKLGIDIEYPEAKD